MKRIVNGLTAFGAGILTMYFLDPRSGKRRRAMATARGSHQLKHVEQCSVKALRDAGNRFRGKLHELRNRWSQESVSDGVLEARVRSQLGRHASHVHAIRVQAEQGHVLLSGTIVEAELPGLLRAVRKVPGVRSIENLLEVSHELAATQAPWSEQAEERSA